MLAPPDQNREANGLTATELLDQLEWQHFELEDKTEALDTLLRESAYEGIVLSNRNEELEMENEMLRRRIGVVDEDDVEAERLAEAVSVFDAEVSHLLEERDQLSEQLGSAQREHEELLRSRIDSGRHSPPGSRRSVDELYYEQRFRPELSAEERQTAQLRIGLEQSEQHHRLFYGYLENNVESLHDRFDALQEEASRQRAECRIMEEEVIESLMSTQELRFEMGELGDLLDHPFVTTSSIGAMRMTMNHTDDTTAHEEYMLQAGKLREELEELREKERLEGITGDAVDLWTERTALEQSIRQLNTRCRRLERDEATATRDAERHQRELRKAEGVGHLTLVAQEERMKLAGFVERERLAADGREREMVRTLQALMHLDEFALMPLV